MPEPLTITVAGASGAALGAGLYRLVLAVLPLFTKNNGNGKFKNCPDHLALITRLSENTAAVNNLVARADKHHDEQREDNRRIFEKLETQGRQLAEHAVRIENLQSDIYGGG